jgi:hypothetical protein
MKLMIRLTTWNTIIGWKLIGRTFIINILLYLVGEKKKRRRIRKENLMIIIDSSNNYYITDFEYYSKYWN